MSNIIDAYCVYCCAQEVKKHTEETKKMTSKKAYINRKRYYLLQTPKNTRFPNLNPKTVIFWFTVFHRANSFIKVHFFIVHSTVCWSRLIRLMTMNIFLLFQRQWNHCPNFDVSTLLWRFHVSIGLICYHNSNRKRCLYTKDDKFPIQFCNFCHTTTVLPKWWCKFQK